MRVRWLATLTAALLGLLPSASGQLPARWPRAPLTEVARTQVSADLAFERFGLTGRGSTLCLVDTDVDVDIDPARVRAIWSPGAAPRGHPLEARIGGAVYAGSEVREGPADRHGHGTAMASIALGSEGFAPEATLLVAAAWDPVLRGFPDDDVVRGILFCRGIAATDDSIDIASMVILLSLGGHDGSHGGEGAFERAILEAAGAVPVVVAAGNDGERSVHATGRVFHGESARVGVQIPRSSLEDASVGLTLRLVSFDDDASARLVSPGGSRSGPIEGADSFSLGGSDVQVETRDDALSITIRARDGVLESGAWGLEIGGSARFDVWLAGTRLGSTFLPASLTGTNVVAGESITIPATSPSVIAVGALVARTSVGELTTLGSAGDVAAFSSRGPTSAGVPKPDIVAPGGWILARLSAGVRPGDPDNLIGGRRDHLIEGRVAVRGSSASAAVVAGALLLALELDPSRGAEARELLVSSTTEAGWTADRGFGALDVERLLARWSGEPSPHFELTASRRLHGLGERGVWLSARGPGDELVVRLGPRVFSTPMRGGGALVFVDPGTVSAGRVLRFEGAIDGSALEPATVLVVPDRHGSFGVGGSGCSAAPGRSPAELVPACLVVALLLLWWWRSQSRLSKSKKAPGRAPPAPTKVSATTYQVPAVTSARST